MLNVGIIGMGYGRQVHLPVFLNLAETNVVALADNGSGRAREAVQSLSGQVSAFSNGLDLASSSLVDLVSVATPPDQQFDIVKHALLAGKHVLCEKPFGISISQAKKLLDLEQKSQGKVCVGYEFPYDAAFMQMKEQVQKGTLGKIQRFKVQWLTSGGFKLSNAACWKTSGQAGTGLLNDWYCHVFDYATRIVGSAIKWVWCKSHSPYEIDITCEFESGTIGQFVVANKYRSELGHKIEILGDKGCLTFTHVPPYGTAQKYLTLINAQTGHMALLSTTHAFEGMYNDNRMAAFHMMVSCLLSSFSSDAAVILPDISSAISNWRILQAAQQSMQSEALEPVL